MDGSHLWSYADTPITRVNPSRSARRAARKARAKRKPTGYVLYEGPSMLDGAPIVVIATGFKGSDNKKTGKMVQTWIMRADMDPMQALYAGADASICGTCPHRGSVIETPITRAVYRAERAKQRHHRGTPYRDPATGAHALRKSEGRACYVVIAQAPLTIWRTWRRGGYPAFNATTMPLEGRILRMGSYGDPVAAPPEVWLAALSAGVEGFTGYTHQWRLPQAQRYSEFLMASVDTPEEAAQAEAMGWRYFRVRGADEPLIAGREIMCPASDEAEAKKGKKITCSECLACGGQRAATKRSVSIIAHGSGARFASERPRLPLARPNPDDRRRGRARAAAVSGDPSTIVAAASDELRRSTTDAQQQADVVNAAMRALHPGVGGAFGPDYDTPSGVPGFKFFHAHTRGQSFQREWKTAPGVLQWLLSPQAASFLAHERRQNPRVPGGRRMGSRRGSRLAELTAELSRMSPRQIIDLFDMAGIEVRDFSGASYEELARILLSGHDPRRDPGYDDDPDQTMRGNPPCPTCKSPDAYKSPFSGRWECRSCDAPKVGSVDSPVVGMRVRLIRDVERFPHFIAKKGMTGTVSSIDYNGPSLGYIWVKMDQHLPGAEDWDNQVEWMDYCLPEFRDDVEVIGGVRRNPGDDDMRRLEREAVYGDPAALAAARAAQERRGIPTSVRDAMLGALGPGGMPKKGFKALTVGAAKQMITAWLRANGWQADFAANSNRALNGDLWISPDGQRRCAFGKNSLSFEIGGRGQWQRDKDFEAKLGKTMMGTLGIKQAAERLLPPPGGAW